MITASQFTAALLLSQSDGDFEPSVVVFQQWASYAGRKEPKINKLLKGTKTGEVKTIDTCRGKNSDQKMGELVIQSPEKTESKIVGTVIKHLIHGISTPSLTYLPSLSGVSFLCCSILPNKKLVVPAEKFRWSQSSWAHFIKQHKEKYLPLVLK